MNNIKNQSQYNQKDIPKIISIRKQNLVKLGYTDLEDWVKNPNNLYIGRKNCFVAGANESKWKNPFPVEKFERDKCLQKYKNYIMDNNKLLNELSELKGKTLGCWCKPEKCHGDILIELFKSFCT